ncbi:GNAT family N-acetyltransferase [Microbulbifer echini]|uniref:GNAT family N-acetyltransferase n=1 Tax=Microbulbifer echini TaxID=1529067 RepID=A0ABV4NRA0_9GAMM|nr:GNAT family N-acetyltransferase [uncultured Microbulbifer sp.]
MFQINTPNLTLRELSDADAELILLLLNDADFLRNIGDRGVRNLKQARDYIQTGPMIMYRQHQFGLFKVALTDGTGIGICGLIKRDSLDDADIGFAFLPEYRGKGYALEAARAVMVFAREQLNLKRIVAITQPENLASVKLLEKIGLKIERRITLPGETIELLLMAWEASSSANSQGL